MRVVLIPFACLFVAGLQGCDDDRGGCEDDMDCKGDRVCVNGACLNPEDSAGSGGSAGGGGAGTGGQGSGGSGGSSGSGGSAGGGGSSWNDLIAPLAPDEIPESARDCDNDDECLVVHVLGSCCGDCESSYHRDWVESEPCVIEVDFEGTVPDGCRPDPADCPGGCPGYECPEQFGAACVEGRCHVVTEYGPCASDDDCVLAVHYTPRGIPEACCGCPEVTPMVRVESDECIVLDGESRPAACELDTPSCADVTCPDPPDDCDRPSSITCKYNNCRWE
jgi:hypothetical protein